MISGARKTAGAIRSSVSGAPGILSDISPPSAAHCHVSKARADGKPAIGTNGRIIR
jgi:hypothetical protein